MTGDRPFVIRQMMQEDVPGAVALQKLAFPPPFSEDLHWDPEHLLHHVAVFPTGQWIAESEGQIVGSCSNAIISEARWQAHGSWGATVGGPYIHNHDSKGSTLYGLDITVHPEFRRIGIGRAFYAARFDLIRTQGLTRYGTGCRIPDFRQLAQTKPGLTPEAYVSMVQHGEFADRTLTPLLRYGLKLIGVVDNYMEDEESGNAGALLEWTR